MQDVSVLISIGFIYLFIAFLFVAYIFFSRPLMIIMKYIVGAFWRKTRVQIFEPQNPVQ